MNPDNKDEYFAHIKKLAADRHLRLLHRRGNQYWLMAATPMTLTAIEEMFENGKAVQVQRERNAAFYEAEQRKQKKAQNDKTNAKTKNAKWRAA